jgi:hypothetical protein
MGKLFDILRQLHISITLSNLFSTFFISYVDLIWLMVLKRNSSVFTPFLIAVLSVMLVTTYATANTLISISWANTPQILDVQFSKYFVKIQDNADKGSDNQSSKLRQDSDGTNPSLSEEERTNEMSSSNDTETESTNQSLSGLSEEERTNEMSSSNDTETESTNQSMSGLSEEEGTNENINQTTETQQTQNQLQNNNQEVNVNNTVNNQIQINQRLESIISEEEGEKPIPLEEQKKVESEDIIVMREHKSLTGPNCRTGNVLSGASNEGDLKVLAECQEAVGIVKHTKKMDDGDFKFFLDLDEKYKFLVNEKNIQKTDGFLVVEIVPQDQNIENVYLPKTGDQVHIWGAWVTDKPKGWHEMHPAWKSLMS